MIFQLTIPGVPVSGNHRHGLTPQGEIYLTRRARDYSARVQSIAQAQVALTGWTMPDYCRVDMHLINVAMDRDNVAKTIHDALQGIAYSHDSRILDGFISKLKIAGPAKVLVWVQPVDGSKYGFSPPRVSALPGPRRKRSLPSHVRAAIDAAQGE